MRTDYVQTPYAGLVRCDWICDDESGDRWFQVIRQDFDSILMESVMCMSSNSWSAMAEVEKHGEPGWKATSSRYLGTRSQFRAATAHITDPFQDTQYTLDEISDIIDSQESEGDSE